MESLGVALLRELGLFSAVALVLGAAARPFIAKWIERRIDAGVEEGLRQRLATFQLDLDKELEQHKSALVAQVERLRSSLERDTVDYGLYASKKHEAIASLFAEYLRSETLIVDMWPVMPGASEHMSTETLTALLERLGATPTECTNLLEMHEQKSYGLLDTQLTIFSSAAKRARAGSARNDAYEAYFRYALYLPELVDRAAIAVRDYFHTALMPYVAPDPEAGTETVKNKIKLRVLMLDYQNAARAELSRAAVNRDPPPLPTVPVQNPPAEPAK